MNGFTKDSRADSQNQDMRKTNLRDALLLWQEHAYIEDHLSQEKIDNIAKGYGNSEDIDHLTKCPTCREMVWERLDRVYADLEDIVLPI